MRIIKEGDITKTIKHFTCQNCGCEWEANAQEYNVSFKSGYLWMRCPCCELEVIRRIYDDEK